MMLFSASCIFLALYKFTVAIFLFHSKKKQKLLNNDKYNKRKKRLYDHDN